MNSCTASDIISYHCKANICLVVEKQERVCVLMLFHFDLSQNKRHAWMDVNYGCMDVGKEDAGM